MATFTSCYYLSVLVIGRWWSVLGKVASGRGFTSLPVRVVASLYLMSLGCITVSAWALIFHHPAWVYTVVGVGWLMLVLTVLAEGPLPRWRPAERA